MFMKLSYNEREKARASILDLTAISPDEAAYIMINGADIMAKYNFVDGNRLRIALIRRALYQTGEQEGENFGELLANAGSILEKATKKAQEIAKRDSSVKDDIEQLSTLRKVMDECVRHSLVSAYNLIW